jgi:NAD(P)H-hydrate epimerase
MPLPTALYSTAQVRALDAYAIDVLGIPGYTLMKRAGEAALRYLRSRWPTSYRLAIVCGGGNNGGDGYVLARFARAAGLEVKTLAVVPVESLHGDARLAYEELKASGGQVEPFDAATLSKAEVVVDALLGTGLKATVRDEATLVIRAINACGKPVLALDVPSGLDSDSGMALGVAVRAECTVTFVGMKVGLLNGDGPQFTGQLLFDDLEITPPKEPRFEPQMTRIAQAELAAALPRRARAAHKGTFGKVLIAGGGIGMPGAIRLAGEACLRVGAGLVTIASASENVPAIIAGRPELVGLALDEPGLLRSAIERVDVIAVGPGLGQSVWAQEVLGAALASDKPTVLDADALNLLAKSKTEFPSERRNWILTPHPGEAARLLGVEIEQVQSNRLQTLEALVRKYRCVVVLKGAGTLVGAPEQIPGICNRGNPGMATAGMGDVLTGTIAGILAQCHDPWVAARVGVLVHAMAGDAAARSGERGLIASDVIKELRACLNP